MSLKNPDMGRRAFVAAGVGLALSEAGPAIAAPDPPFEVILESDVRVPMRDGVRLATDVYIPPATTERRRVHSPP